MQVDICELGQPCHWVCVQKYCLMVLCDCVMVRGKSGVFVCCVITIIVMT